LSLGHISNTKCKFFIWLITQNSVWMSDRLQKEVGCTSPTCPLCRCAPETAHHLLVDGRYTKRIWNLTVEWTAQPTLRLQEWQSSNSVAQWWSNTTMTPHIDPHKAMASIIVMLIITWKIWKERNSRVFKHHETSATALMSTIKQEARAWVAAGAKDLAGLVLRE